MLLRAEVNVVQTYPLLVQHHGRPIVAIMVDNLEIAMDTINQAGLTLVSEMALLGDAFE